MKGLFGMLANFDLLYLHRELQFRANFWYEGITQDPLKEYGIISHNFKKIIFVTSSLRYSIELAAFLFFFFFFFFSSFFKETHINYLHCSYSTYNTTLSTYSTYNTTLNTYSTYNTTLNTYSTYNTTLNTYSTYNTIQYSTKQYITILTLFILD